MNDTPRADDAGDDHTARRAAFDVGDEFSDLARQRRLDAETQAAIPPPTFVQGIEHSEFNIIFEPQAIPLRYIDPEVLQDLIGHNYHAALENPNLGPLIRATSLEAVQEMTPTERLTAAWALPDATLKFTNGRLTTKYGFVPIRSIYVDFEKILVSVEGITSLAEAVAYEMIELLWRSAGVERKYSEVESSVRMIAYATSTRVDFGVAGNHFLANSFRKQIENSFGPGGPFAGSFGPRSHRHDFKPSTNVVSNVTLDELHLQVAQFDLDTGRTFAGTLEFSVTAKDDHGTGRLMASSHLPYEEHVQLLDAIRTSLPHD